MIFAVKVKFQNVLNVNLCAQKYYSPILFSPALCKMHWKEIAQFTQRKLRTYIMGN